MCSVVPNFEVLWTVGHRAPLSTEFSREEYWSRLPCPPPGDLPDPGWNPRPLQLTRWLADSLATVPLRKPFENLCFHPVKISVKCRAREKNQTYSTNIFVLYVGILCVYLLAMFKIILSI